MKNLNTYKNRKNIDKQTLITKQPDTKKPSLFY